MEKGKKRNCFIRARVTPEMKTVIKQQAEENRWSESTLIETVMLEKFKDKIEQLNKNNN